MTSRKRGAVVKREGAAAPEPKRSDDPDNFLRSENI